MRVAEQFLHAPQIRARIQQMGRIAVPQLVRGQFGIQPRHAQDNFSTAAPIAPGSAASALFGIRAKNRLRPHRRLQQNTPIRFNRLQRRFADGHHAALFCLCRARARFARSNQCPPPATRTTRSRANRRNKSSPARPHRAHTPPAKSAGRPLFSAACVSSSFIGASSKSSICCLVKNRGSRFSSFGSERFLIGKLSTTPCRIKNL